MKPLLSILILAACACAAQAAPYLVYSATVSTTYYSSPNQTAPMNDLFFLVTDEADTSNYAVLIADQQDLTNYNFYAFPDTNTTTYDTNNNFFGGIVASNGKSGEGVFSLDLQQGSTTEGVYAVTKLYATGALSLKPVTLAPARYKPLTVVQKGSSASNGSVTFSTLSPTLTSGSTPIPTSLSGIFYEYYTNNGSDLNFATNGVTVKLTLDAALTAAANIGGGYTSGRNVVALQPIDVTSAATPEAAFEGWLNTLATGLGYYIYNPGPPGGGTLTLDGGDDGGGVTIGIGVGNLGGGSWTYLGTTGGTLQGTGTVTQGIGGGTFIINNGGGSVINLGNLGSAGSGDGGTLTIQSGGTIATGSTTTSGGLTFDNNTGSTLWFSGGTLNFSTVPPVTGTASGSSSSSTNGSGQ